MFTPFIRQLKVPALLVAIAGSGLLPGAARAQAPAEGSLDAAVASLAGDIANELRQRAEVEIAMGPFDGPGSGQVIKAKLKDELEKLEVDGEKITVSNFAAWKVTADIIRDENQAEPVVVQINARLKDRSGLSAGTIIKYVTEQEDILKIFGPSSFEAPKEPAPGKTIKETTAEAIKEALEKPQPALAASPAPKKTAQDVQVSPPKEVLAQTTIKPSESSPFQVEILVEESPGNYVPVGISNANGLAVVDLTEKQVYAIRIINNSGAPVGCDVSIDGINVFAFSKVEAYKKGGKLRLEGPETVVKGWHIFDGPGGSRKFLITEWGESAQALLGSRDESQIGKVTVNFHHTWLEGETPPEGAVLARTSELGTGLGDPVDNEYKPKACFFGAVKGSVSIRYAKPVIDPALPPGS